MQYYHLRAVIITLICKSMIPFYIIVKKRDLKECEVIAVDVSGKKSKKKLDLILPST